MSTNNKHDHRKIYWKIWAALVIMTGITVWTSYYDFGTMNIVVAMLIASTKATLVALFFMHLKYGNKTNIVVFLSSLFCLALFVGLTASDMLDRGLVEPMKVVDSGGGADMGDVAKLAKVTPEQITEGKKIFAANCISCHGTEGKGNGPAAAAFTPKPRNFTSGEWKNGGKPTEIFQTLISGLGSMPSFAALPAEQRWALVHYVRSLSPKRPEDSTTDVTALAAKSGKSAAQLPIRVALELSAVPEIQAAVDIKKTIPQPDSEGGQLYQNRCATCHGPTGQGGIRVRVLGSNPFSYLATSSFANSHAAWVSNAQEFIRINSQGLPGFGKPGISDLTPTQWQALYGYVQQLAGAR